MNAASPASRRLDYLDWLRGISVLVMIEAHAFDAWTLPVEKGRALYSHLIVLGGFAAPLFLFLAGVAAALAASSRIARGWTPRDAARRVERRGLEILLLAFLFRLQSFVFGWFTNPAGILKVDILNVMGPSIVAAGAFWRIPVSRSTRAVLLAAATLAVALATPAVRQAAWVDALPWPLAAYLRPPSGRGAFTLLPWSAFVFAGAVLGLVIDAARRDASGWRLHGGIALAGGALALACWWASWQPAVFAGAAFWTTSPAFFGLRVGLLLVAVAVAWLWCRRPWRRWPSPIERLGIGSLFVYWVHVELVYGLAGRPLRGRLTLEEAAVAWAALTLLMHALLAAWQFLRATRRQDPRAALPSLTPERI
ncbi:MAG TPA: heparan-alpha-glucosaminide N-acetyltransferase domain-containing protein [Vicinamibacterales bacterium]